MKISTVLAVVSALALGGGDRVLSAPADPWQDLAFLLGTWEARTQSGSADAVSNGTYTFALELNRHVLARHSSSAACQGPETFDCNHGDLLYAYPDADGRRLKAIYFDNEGHVIHYAVSTPAPSTAVFLSDASAAGPQFQLLYQLKGALMSGKFQMRMPGQTEWKSYLEWSGARK